MVIQIQDLEYKIEGKKLSKELSKIFHRNLSNTPGISKDRFVNWDSKKWETYFYNNISNLVEILIHYKETHTDTIINTINYLQNDILPQQNNLKSLFKLDQGIELLQIDNKDNFLMSCTEKVLVSREYYCFIYAINCELLIAFGFMSPDQAISNLLDPCMGDSNAKSFLKCFDFFIPISRRNYSKIHFRFISTNIQRFDYSCSIEIHQTFIFNVNQLIDAVFIDSSIMPKEYKQHLKTWFHKSGQAPKKVTPMLFDDNDPAVYIAFFLKTIGASQGEKHWKVLKKVDNINSWLDHNLLKREDYEENAIKIPVYSFKDLTTLVRLNGRERGVNLLDKQLNEFFKILKKGKIH